MTPSVGQSNEMCSYKISNESQPMVNLTNFMWKIGRYNIFFFKCEAQIR